MPLAPLSILPRSVMGLAKEVAKALLRRPVVGVSAAARTPDGRWLLVRRGDTGTWGLPGGTLEWGETLRSCVVRELEEEGGVTQTTVGRLIGVYSRPDRDVRFHAVTVLVTAEIAEPTRQPINPLEIREVRLFTDDELPREIAHNMSDLLDAARRGDGEAILE
ncbi:NUDIX hydrolase [Chondromyces crocatus]|uniref:NUDIX hydrolase n=1 Tax=Chondromyces crocatus TaxID=52 RepID=A0A0K1EGT2_CHOCO|nr:NUDIX hydrolase [Chondromyces crocatus]AKT39808.1 NUDIX hydrolase [Chondromyces crocatus]